MREWLKKLAKFWAEIEISKPSHTPSNGYLEGDNKKMVDGKDDKDVSVDQSTLVAKEVNKIDSSKEYKFVLYKIVYNKEWDELGKVTKNEKEENKIKECREEESEIDISQVD